MEKTMDAAIAVERLHKSFEVVERRPGLRGAAAALFGKVRRRPVVAVEDVSFSTAQSVATRLRACCATLHSELTRAARRAAAAQSE